MVWSISACNVLLTVRVITSHLLLTVRMLYFADGHEMTTLNATKLLLLTNQPKVTQPDKTDSGTPIPDQPVVLLVSITVSVRVSATVRVSCIFHIRKIQLTLIVTLTLTDTVTVIICVLSPVTGTQSVQPPVPAAGTLAYGHTDTLARFHLPFYQVCYFESFLTPIHEDEDVDAVKATRPIDEHRVCGFACYRMTDYPQYQTDPLVYSGPDVMNKFYEHIMSESEAIGAILVDDQDMTQLTDRQQTDYDNATTCGCVVRDSRGQTTRSDITII